MLAEQKSIAEIAKELGVSENTYRRWRNQVGGMKADDVKRLEELERENQRLKQIVADQALDVDGLKEIARGNFCCRPADARRSRCSRPPALRRASGLPVGRPAPSARRHEPTAATAEGSDLRRELRDLARRKPRWGTARARPSARERPCRRPQARAGPVARGEPASAAEDAQAPTDGRC